MMHIFWPNLGWHWCRPDQGEGTRGTKGFGGSRLSVQWQKAQQGERGTLMSRANLLWWGTSLEAPKVQKTKAKSSKEGRGGRLLLWQSVDPARLSMVHYHRPATITVTSLTCTQLLLIHHSQFMQLVHTRSEVSCIHLVMNVSTIQVQHCAIVTHTLDDFRGCRHPFGVRVPPV